MKFAFRAGRYTSWNFLVTARRPPPSVTVMNVKNAARPVFLSVPGLELKTSGMTYQQAQRSVGPGRLFAVPAL